MSYESFSLWCTLCPSLTLISYGLPSDVFCVFFWCPLCFSLLSYFPLFMFLMYYVSLWYILWSFYWLLYFSFMSSEPSCVLSVFLFDVLCVVLWWPLSHSDVPSFILLSVCLFWYHLCLSLMSSLYLSYILCCLSYSFCVSFWWFGTICYVICLYLWFPWFFLMSSVYHLIGFNQYIPDPVTGVWL